MQNTKNHSNKLIKVELNRDHFAEISSDIEQERKIAIYDLIQESVFAVEKISGPYILNLSTPERQWLMMKIAHHQSPQIVSFGLALSPFRTIIKDYFIMCDSYYDAIKNAPPSQIETIDMGRRGLHNEGSALLRERLKGKINMDFKTARRLFTLLCALYRK